MTQEKIRQILDICSSLDDVKCDVLKNHDNNMWWPLDITDYKKRLLIAGLSTRISYNMIESYIKIINNLNKYSYNEIKNMNETEIIEIIKGLGLQKTRYKFLVSMIKFIDNHESDLETKSNDELINAISQNVDGASYKVAQCCVLYMRGYYCGIMPVDSGMKDIELPCLGFEKYNNALGHDILRKQLQELIEGNDLKEIIIKNGYENLNIQDYSNATWWAHLVLIYFKRHYCNKHVSNNCPLAKILDVKCLCSQKNV